MSVHAAMPVDRTIEHDLARQPLRLWFSGVAAALGLARRRNG